MDASVAAQHPVASSRTPVVQACVVFAALTAHILSTAVIDPLPSDDTLTQLLLLGYDRAVAGDSSASYCCCCCC